MRDGEWKAIAKLNHKKFQNLHKGNEEAVKAAKITNIEIYRITKDIAEEKNLAAKYSEKLQELKKKLEVEYQALIKGSHVWGK